MRYVLAMLAVTAAAASAQQMTVRARDVSPPPAVATPARPWGAPPSGGGAWGAPSNAGGAWSAWPQRDAWRAGQSPPIEHFAHGRGATIAPTGAVPYSAGGVTVAPGGGGMRGAWFPPRLVVLLLPVCDGWGNCWRQPTQVQAIWHGPWQRYVWIDAAGRIWPL